MWRLGFLQLPIIFTVVFLINQAGAFLKAINAQRKRNTFCKGLIRVITLQTVNKYRYQHRIEYIKHPYHLLRTVSLGNNNVNKFLSNG